MGQHSVPLDKQRTLKAQRSHEIKRLGSMDFVLECQSGPRHVNFPEE